LAVISATKGEVEGDSFSPRFYRCGETKSRSVDHQLKGVITLI